MRARNIDFYCVKKLKYLKKREQSVREVYLENIHTFLVKSGGIQF